jgi:hypothetical protein
MKTPKTTYPDAANDPQSHTLIELLSRDLEAWRRAKEVIAKASESRGASPCFD